MTEPDLTAATLELISKVGGLTESVTGLDRTVATMRAENAVQHERVETRLGHLEKRNTSKDATAEVKRGILRSPYLIQTFAAVLAVLAVYFSASAKQEARAVGDNATTACQATQDLRNRAITGLVKALSEGNMTQRYYDVAIGQLPPKADCSNP
jgi:hypothetical protein